MIRFAVFVAHWNDDGDAGLAVFSTRKAAADACESWLVARFPGRFGGNGSRAKRRRSRAWGEVFDGFEFEQTDDEFYVWVEEYVLDEAPPFLNREQRRAREAAERQL